MHQFWFYLDIFSGMTSRLHQLSWRGTGPKFARTANRFFPSLTFLVPNGFHFSMSFFHEAILLYEKLGGGFKDHLFSLPGENDPI